jgi:glycosyltransferase involved in cell wall biosynthesis
VVRASGAQLHALLPDVVATVIPRRRNAYNDAALPIKAMEYLSYGRPMIVTDCRETADLVRTAGTGIVVSDSAATLADGIANLFAADGDVLEAYARAGHAAARSNAWSTRADRVVATLRSAHPNDRTEAA